MGCTIALSSPRAQLVVRIFELATRCTGARLELTKGCTITRFPLRRAHHGVHNHSLLTTRSTWALQSRGTRVLASSSPWVQIRPRLEFNLRYAVSSPPWGARSLPRLKLNLGYAPSSSPWGARSRLPQLEFARPQTSPPSSSP
ncbi:UNVERIFIED_CONTAM: hypothetical protein Slati_0946400 [Sesamum latifolium]|uniref:Uncharacterized protein n=1 Tax=Sesamum latifolium TaxID=2727402 RepID=A0AAW2XPJ1_9LAMI